MDSSRVQRWISTVACIVRSVASSSSQHFRQTLEDGQALPTLNFAKSTAPSLRYKKANSQKPVYSARITDDYRDVVVDSDR
jgi:hypothetical protein